MFTLIHLPVFVNILGLQYLCIIMWGLSMDSQEYLVYFMNMGFFRYLVLPYLQAIIIER